MPEIQTEFLLITTGFISVAAALPQLIKIIRLKSAREFNLFSWSVWLTYQAISVVYSIQINAIAYAVINAAWTAFYIAMVVAILRYRNAS